MTNDVFEKVIKLTIAQVERSLLIKGLEYGSGEGVDRLRQFKTMANITSRSALQELFSLQLKHITAYHDYINNPEDVQEEWFMEKTLDIINYCILARALFMERGRTNLKGD